MDTSTWSPVLDPAPRRGARHHRPRASDISGTRAGQDPGEAGRTGARTAAPEATAPDAAAPIILVGSRKATADQARRARELYLSPLFERRRRYAERYGGRWYLLSAEHGLVDPDALLEPHDAALTEKPERYRRAWGERIVAALRQIEGDLRGRTIEVHAAAAYVAPLRWPLATAGALLREPLSGLGLGEQLSWYDHAHAVAVSTRRPPDRLP